MVRLLNCFKNHKTPLIGYKWAAVPTYNTSLDVWRSKDEAICSHLDLPGDSFLVESSGRLCMALPMLALTCLVLDSSSQAPLFVGQGLQCRIFRASLSGCSTRPSSASTWPFFEKLGLWLHPNNLGSTSIDCCCCARQRTPSWCW